MLRVGSSQKKTKAAGLRLLHRGSESSSCFSLKTGFLHMVRQMATKSAQVLKRMTSPTRGTEVALPRPPTPPGASAPCQWRAVRSGGQQRGYAGRCTDPWSCWLVLAARSASSQAVQAVRPGPQGLAFSRDPVLGASCPHSPS